MNEQERFIRASQDGNISEVKKLIRSKKVDSSFENDLSIRIASENGHTEVVKLLLQDPRVDPSANNNEAIRYASKYGRIEVVKLLLQDPRVNPAANDNEAIRLAAQYGHLDIVKLLLQDSRVDPAAETNYAIKFASLNGHVKVVKLLLQDPRVNPAANDNHAIQWASESGHAEVVKLLLQDPRADPSDNDNYAIRAAARGGHYEIVKLLLQDERVDPSAASNSALTLVRAYSKNKRVEKLLLKDPRVQLGVAIDIENTKRVKELLKNPKVNLNNALNQVAETLYLDITKLILSVPSVNPSTNDNYLLKNVIKHNNMPIFKLILKNPRTDLSLNDNEILKLALMERQYRMVKLLLKDKKVNPAANGNSVLKFILKDGNREMVDILAKDPRVKNEKTELNTDDYSLDRIADILQLFPDLNLDLSYDNNRLLKRALNENRLSVVELILKNNSIYPIDDIIVDVERNPKLRDTYLSILKEASAIHKLRRVRGLKQGINPLLLGPFQPVSTDWMEACRHVGGVEKLRNIAKEGGIISIDGVPVDKVKKSMLCYGLHTDMINKEKKFKHAKRPKCENDADLLGTDFSDMNPDFIFKQSKGSPNCYSIEDLDNIILKGNKIDPYTGVPFEEKFVKCYTKVRGKYKARPNIHEMKPRERQKSIQQKNKDELWKVMNTISEESAYFPSPILANMSEQDIQNFVRKLNQVQGIHIEWKDVATGNSYVTMTKLLKELMKQVPNTKFLGDQITNMFN